MSTRFIILLVVLAGAAAGWFFLGQPGNLGQGLMSLLSGEVAPGSPVSSQQAKSLPFDEDTKSKIRQYMDGVRVAANENNLNEAIRLDHSVGRVQLSQGQWNAAYRTYQKVLAISYGQGSLMGVGIALNVISDILEKSNNKSEALHTSLLAYKAAKAMNNKEEIGVMELKFARMLKDDDLSTSMMWLLRAKESLKNSRYREDYIRLLPTLAGHLKLSHKEEMAAEIYKESWDLARLLKGSPARKWTKWEVGVAYASYLLGQKRFKQAAAVLHEMEPSFDEPERKTESYTAVLHLLAKAYASIPEEAGRAEHYYLKAYANYELTRAKAPGEEGRSQLDNDNKGMVDGFVSYYLKSKDNAAALALLESNKARTMNDILGDSGRKEAYTQWHNLEQRHAQEQSVLVSSDELLPPVGEDNSEKLWALIKRQDEERRKLRIALQLEDIAVTRGISSEEINKISSKLTSDVAVLSYFVGEDRASAFVITRAGLRHIPLDFDARQFRNKVMELRVSLTNPYNDFYYEPARWLYQRFLAPVVETLPDSVKIIVYSPDGILSRVPLTAFMDGDRFAGQRYAVYRLPSLRYLASLKTVKAGPVGNGVVCVDPEVPNARLPFQQETGRVLKGLYGKRSKLLLGKDCSEKNLVGAIRGLHQPAFLHIGAHGNFYPSNAMDSAILLSPKEGEQANGKAWTANAMATLKADHLDLVTLSSCETGLTDPNTPRDVFGITRALFFAGAKKVMAPLWAVHDQASADFMQSFYQAYANGNPAILALQQAQNRLIKDEKYKHPYYWSPFVLTGEAR